MTSEVIIHHIDTAQIWSKEARLHMTAILR